MAPVTADVRAPGGISGAGSVVVVDNASDNTLVAFRFKLPQVRMQAAEEAFEAGGHHFGAGSFIIADANQAQLAPVLRDLGLAAWALPAVPAVKAHDLTVPRIGYVHSWQRTQDEGWVRAALDYYGVPFSYFGEPVLKTGNLRARYDVIIYPHGGSGVGAAAGGRGGAGFGAPATPDSNAGGRGGRGAVAPKPIPYRHTAEFPALGYPDSTDDINGGAGEEGMRALYEFVQQGGTLITEGNTASIFPNLNLTPGLKVEQPQGLFANGTILRGMIIDRSSPLVYGYDHREVPVYFSNAPVLNSGQPAAATIEVPLAAGGRGRGYSQNITPMAAPNRVQLSPWDPDHTGTPYGVLPADSTTPPAGRGGRGGGGGGAPGRGGGGAAPQALQGVSADPNARMRVVMSFPEKASDMLLSGTLAGGEALAGRAQLVDETVGKGHIVMFAFRPYWRWQTQGTFAMGFNAIVNWDHLDAGK